MVNKVRRAAAITELVLDHDTTTTNEYLLAMWQDQNNHYGASSSHSHYYPVHPQQSAPLQFYAAGSDQGQFYPGSRSSLEGNLGTSTSIPSESVAQAYGGTIQQPSGWWTAFGTGGFEGEPPLLEGERRRIRFLVSVSNQTRRTGHQLFAYTS